VTAVLRTLHVRADAVTQEAVTEAAATDAAPTVAAKGIFVCLCSATSPLPAAFCNILCRFSKLSSGEARTSVNEAFSKCHAGVVLFESVQMRSANEGETVFQASACAVSSLSHRDCCACDADVCCRAIGARTTSRLVAAFRLHAPV
jgi:hypothetical protein